MKFVHYLSSPVFLSVILLTGVMILGSLTLDVFAADKQQNVKYKDKNPLQQITQSNIESLKGLNANEKRVIVFYKNDVTSKDLTELTKKGANVKSDFDKMRAVVVHIDAAKLKDIQLDPNVERVVEDQIVHASLDTSIPQIGANSVYSLGITGQGVKTCIVDTGVDDTHPALNPLIAEINYVPLIPTGDATDDNGHGTHVAGIVASNDATYRGVAPGSSLMAAKVLDSNGSGFTSDVASGIDWCVANGADVINLSLGSKTLFTGTCNSNIDAIAVNNAVAAGVIVAVASGNNGAINAVSSPACASGAIAVGAVNDSDGRTPFSNEGPQLDVVAPGAPITSLKAPINGGGFATFYGTSMATPHVAGLAALILDANPTLTQTQVRSAIENNALDLGDAGFDTLYGNGRIQASNSVNSVLPHGIIIPPRAFLSINSGGSGTILSVFGSGFTSGFDVIVQFDDIPFSITPATNGAFTTPITIPASISGMHTISASDGVNTFTNQFIVIAPRVTPTGTLLILNPINSSGPDSVVLLHGKGFAGNAEDTIVISVDGVPITTTTVGKVGSFKNISITIPSTLGTHIISASDGANTAFSTFYIIP